MSWNLHTEKVYAHYSNVMNELTADKFQKDLKVRKFTLENGACVLVRMPDRSVNLSVTREGMHYHLGFVTAEPVNQELLGRVQKWYENFLSREISNGTLDQAQLKRAFDGIRQQYRVLHMPGKPFNLDHIMRMPNFEVTDADVKEPCRDYSYKEVMDALSGRGHLQWGALDNHGNQCIRVVMPDPSTNLIIRRWQSRQGNHHEVLVLDAEGANSATVEKTRKHIDTFMGFHARADFDSLGAESVKNLLYGIRNFDTNKFIDPSEIAPPKGAPIQV